MTKKIISAMLCVSIVIFWSLAGAESKTDTKAIQAAGSWLTLVDDGNSSESWNNAAVLFKNNITQEKWKHTVNAVRLSFGKVISRKLKSTQQLAPDGNYLVIEYETCFEHKKNAVETIITPMLDKDGKWRVAGYYIK